MCVFKISRYRLRPALIAIFILLGGLIAFPTQSALAHPLGNFSINRYSQISVMADQLRLFYVVDMAEIPTFQMMPEIDSDGDGIISDEEAAGFAARQAEAIESNLLLQLNGRSLPLTHQDTKISFPVGQGELLTTRLELTFSAPLSGQSWSFFYLDNNFQDRLGWQEVVVQPTDGVSFLTSTVPQDDVSGALTQYPDDMLQAPLAVSQAEWTAQPGAAQTNQQTIITGESRTAVSSTDRFSTDRFAELIAFEDPGPGLLTAVLLVAFGLGALHALSPGHGKTIVGAYLVGSRGTAKHALFLGLTTTVTHTAGVFAFGFLVLFASKFILPEQLYPWLGVLSGLFILVIGASLLNQRRRDWHNAQNNHEEVDGYHTHFGVGHTHTPPTDNPSWRNLLALGVSGGLLPCPSALVLLLSAIALQRVGFGLLLIVMFSVGLATVLTAIGLMLVYASRFFGKVGSRHPMISRVIPVLSAGFVTIAGLVMTVQALWQIMPA